MREGYPRDGVSGMGTQSAPYEPYAWWLTRNHIGQDLRKLYEVPRQLPPKLLALVRKLDVVEGNQLSPHSRTLLKKLDVIEGKYLCRYAPPIEPRSVDPSDDDWSLCT